MRREAELIVNALLFRGLIRSLSSKGEGGLNKTLVV